MPSPSLPAAPRRAVLLAAMLGSALWLAGCAALQPKTPEEIVAQRVEQRWAALIARDFDKAWGYTQPSYRAAFKREDYAKRFGTAGQWRGVQVHGVTCEAERCAVRIRLTTRLMLPPAAGRDVVGFLDETWVREDGQWWFYQAL